MSASIERLSPAQAETLVADLTALLVDSVECGASVGFLPPLSKADAVEYWREVFTDMRSGKKILLAAMEDGTLAGSVQLELALKPNATHRAEVQKLMVHTTSADEGGVAR